ncbi:hypothetical protein J5N97_004236 [Dioscorea zingiberensis]|uniref:J domain-containing protein n=1 Tax=Dioscorea zingiberensis TaxID=325984 RepID=A0A9D5D5Q0_9LILI|nr:hypothetical protein J5N97_004236 [Dioscorea zingiberensis]
MEDPQAALPAGRPRTRHSRKGASVVAGGGGMKLDYDDVFGGQPRFSAPAKAARADEYAEIFGGFAASCSIPFLELPMGFDDVDAQVDPREPGFDYGEIFGGFGAADFGVSLEELVAEKKPPEDWNGRVPKKTGVKQQAAEVSHSPSEIPVREFVESVEKDEIILDLHHSNGGIEKLDVSDCRRSWGGPEESESAPVPQLNTASVVDFCSQKSTSDSIQEMEANDLSLSSESSDPNRKIADMKQDKISMPASDDGSTDCSVIDLKDVKALSTKSPASEDVSANLQSLSRSSSYHSTSSGDISFHDPTYVTISDINLKTQPLLVPPPSRPPPKLANKQGHPKIKIYSNAKDVEGSLYNRKYYNSSFSKTDTLQGPAKDSSCFFDVEVDASSAAAASAAAMKEAMEQAQAKLKSAKELMERKRDSFQSWKKLAQHDKINLEERKQVEAAEEVNTFSGDVTQMTLAKEAEKINGFSRQERQKNINTTKISIDREEKEICADKEQTLQGKRSKSSAYNLEEKTGESKIDNQYSEQEEKGRDKLERQKHTKATKIVIDQEEKEVHAGKEQTLQGTEWKSSQYNLEEKSGEWKIDNQYYELINNDKKCKPAPNLSEPECVEKKLKATKVLNEHEQDSKMTETPNEFKKSRKLWAVNEPHEIESKKKVNTDTLVRREEEIKEILSAIREAHVLEKSSDIQEVPGVFSLDEENREKSEDSQEVYPVEEDETKEDAIEEITPNGNGSTVDENELHVTSERHEDEKVQNISDKTSVMDGSGKEFEVLKYTFMPESGEKFIVSQEDILLENFEKRCKSSELRCSSKIHETDSKTDVLPELERNNSMSMMQESCVSVENDKGVYINEETNESEENVKIPKAAQVLAEQSKNRENIEATQVPLGHTEIERKKEDEKEISLEDWDKKAKETPKELEDDEEHMAEYMTKNSDEMQMLDEADNLKKENKKPKGVQAASNLRQDHNYVNKAPVVCQNPADFELESAVDLDKNCDNANTDQVVGQQHINENLEAVQQLRLSESEKKGNVPNLVKVDSESNFVAAVDYSTINSHKTEVMKTEGRKREIEWAKKLEEKEREREREKDRLAVERATREAHERALAEARERAERIAVERVTAEARQRAQAEAREKAEKASSEALEKSLAEKASREAKLRAERAAVERATAEARERFVERAIAEKAAAEAREQAERLNGSFRDKIRKDNEAANNLRCSDKGDGGIRIRPSSYQDIRHNESQSAVSSSNNKKYSVSNNHVSNGKLEGAGSESALRCKARLERHQRTVERAAKALAEKNMRDILAQREQAERNRLAESLDADVKRWSNGKESNLRALLSTLQYILGPESGWQPIPLTEVITAAAVKKAYRRATLCVHPDKLQQRGASIQQKYICEKVFDLLKEAWNKFNSEER